MLLKWYEYVVTMKDGYCEKNLKDRLCSSLQCYWGQRPGSSATSWIVCNVLDLLQHPGSSMVAEAWRIDKDDEEKRAYDDPTVSSKKRKCPSSSKSSKKGLDSVMLDSVARPFAKVAWFRVVLDETREPVSIAKITVVISPNCTKGACLQKERKRSKKQEVTMVIISLWILEEQVNCTYKG
ncbi:hypothetical protein LR48_Vigan10g116600 [Vigna angularis]|uniref:Uncharacterized protein n=1 Tax=Phaseolus angularis TaxID=3914 RepID=A0A0L9VKL4_PHAAN|nr:hypothetical protein LR48_Vigan10g116600 [Vigna angularis]